MIVIPSIKFVSGKDGEPEWIKAMREELAVMKNYRVVESMELGDGGSFEDWVYWNRGVKSICFELSEQLKVSRFNEREIEYLRVEEFIYKFIERIN
jgi:hypothetical protein